MAVTVLGADGFIGSHVVQHLKSVSTECREVRRGDMLEGHLGDIIDCVGITADFRTRPYEAMDAHVGRVLALLQSASFDSYLYLSSTRVYRRATDGHEDTAVPVRSSDPDDLYAISKLAGEAACLRHPDPRVRVVRLSNVYGVDVRSETFLASVIRAALVDGRVTLRLQESSARDFVAVSDVAPALVAIAAAGKHRLYNLASGQNVLAGDVVKEVCRLTGAALTIAAAGEVSFPVISIDRAQQDLGFAPHALMNELPGLVDTFREELRA